MPLLEQDALFLTSNFDQFDAEKQAAAKDWLRRYKDQQDEFGLPDFPTQESERRNREIEFREMFKSPEAIKYEPAQFSVNPILDKQQHANMALLARAYQKEPLEIATRYEFYLNDYASQRFSKKEIDTAGFYAEARKMIERDEKRENAFLEGSRAALRGENVISSLQGWQGKNLDMMEDSSQFTQGFLRAQEKAGDMIPLADKMLKLIESGTGKSRRGVPPRVFDADAAKELDDMTAELATMKPRERKEVYASIAARVEAAGYDQKGFWSQMLGQIDQGLFRMSQTVPQGMGSVLGTIGEFVGGEDTVSDREFRDRLAKERGEETTAEMKLRQEKLGEVQSEIAQIISGTVDPVKSTVGWIPDYLEAGAIKGPGAVLPFMTASAALGPYGAGLVFTADFAEQNRRDLVAAGLDRDDAARIGMMAAPLQAAVESLSNAFQLGKWASPIAPGSSFLKRYVTNSITSLGAEFTEEQLQDNIIRPIVQDVVGMIDANVPQIGFGEMWDKMKSDTPELISVLAPMALVFGGVMTNADLQLSRDMTGNVDCLTALGYSSAQATEVIQAKDETGRIAKARELWGVRAGTKESMQSGAAKLSEKWRLLQSDASTAQAELERRGMLPRMLHAEEGNWRLTFNDGSVADFQTHNEANAARWSWAQDQLGEFHAITRETLASLEKNLDVGREVAVEFKPDARTAADAVKDGASREMIGRRIGQGKALGDVDAGTTYDEAMATDKAASIGDEFLSSLQILGSSKTEFLDGIMRTTIKLWEGSNVLTLVEEKLEGDAKAMMRTPQGRDWLLSRLRNYEQVSGDKVFRDVADEQLQNDDIVEAWSHVGQSYLVGRSTFGEPLQGKAMRRFGRFLMRAGLGGAFNSESAFFAAVAGRAQKLMEAKKAGTLPADFTEELERQLGIDSQVKHDAGALQEAASIIDTSGYSEETPGPNGETFSISSKELRVKIEVSPDSTTLGNLGITEGFHANHGGEVVPDFAPRASKQGRKGQYAGFYLGPAINEVSQYGQNVSTFPLNPNTPVKVLRRPGQVERITPEMAAAWRAEGFSVVVGPAIIPSKIEIATLSANVLNTPGPNGETFSIRQLAEDFQQKGKFYRVIQGEDAFRDVVESGLVRTNAAAKVVPGATLLERLKERPTAFPSFSKDYAAMSYAQSNPDHYIIVTDDASLQPSTSGRHSKGKTHFPTNAQGEHLSALPADKVDIFRHIGDGMYQLAFSRGKVVSDETFSLSRATPADSSNVVQMPDGARLVGPTTFSIRAYHGTPHKVDKFRTDKIGTGEGAQAYGWGLYFAEGKAVAENYRKTLSDRGIQTATIDGGKQLYQASLEAGYNRAENEQNLIEALKNYFQEGGVRDALEFGGKSMSEVLDQFKTRLEGQRSNMPDYREYYDGVLSVFDKIAKRIDADSVKPKGNLYTVELLPDESEFLDWDKPLAEQHEKVQQVFFDLLSDLTGKMKAEMEGKELVQREKADALGVPRTPVNIQDTIDLWLNDATASGAGLYDLIRGIRGKGATPTDTAKAASKYLASIGIPGIRYLDAGSRGTGDGTRNFVIFDENLVRILEENGKPVETFSLGKVTPAQDAEYMAAVEAGDMKKAQRMVDEAALSNATKVTRHTEEKTDTPLDGTYRVDVDGILYRTVTQSDWDRIESQGFLDSDQRNAVSRNEGVNLANNALSSITYAIPGEDSVLLGIKPEGIGLHGYTDDSYIRTWDKIPYDSIIPLGKFIGQETKPSYLADITYDESGNVIPLSQRFNPADNRITYSLRSGDFEARAAAMFSPFQRTPELRMAIARVAKERVFKVIPQLLELRGELNANAKERADIEIRFSEEMAMLRTDFEADEKQVRDERDFELKAVSQDKGSELDRERLRRTADKKLARLRLDYERTAAEAEKRKASELSKFDKKDNRAQRDRIKQLLRVHDALLSAIPAKVRPQVGGYAPIAELNTDEKAIAFLEDRVQKMEKVLEKWLKKELLQRIAKLFKKFAPKKDDKGRIKSNITAEAAEDIGFAFDFASLDDANQEKEMAAIEKTLEESEDAAEIQDAIGKLAIVQLFHKLENRESSELAAAATWLDELGSGAREARKIIDAARAEQVKEAKDIAKADASNGKLSSLPDAENVEADVRSSTFKRFTNDVKGFLNSALFTMGQQLEIVFGQDSRITTEFHRRAVRAANDSTDIKRDIEARRAAFVADLFGTTSRIKQAGRMGALTVPSASGVVIETGGKTKTIDVPADVVLRIIEGTADLKALGFTKEEAATLADAWADNDALPVKRQKRVFQIERRGEGKDVELTMSQDEAIQYLLWSNQKASREQMGRDGWSEESFQQLNAFLSDDAKALASFFADEYARMGRLIEPVYRRMFNAPFPQVDNYSPIFRDISKADSIIDIDQQGHGSGVSSGFILARNKNARSALRRTSAISAFMQHAESAAHWITHVELVRDLRSVLIDKEVQNAIRSSGRTAAANGIKKRVMQLENQGKVGAAGIAALDSWGSRLLQARAFKGLAWRISPVMKQASAYFNPLLADVPAWDYMRGTARLLSGQLDVSAMWNSPDIQRRIESGFSAEARIAMDKLGYTGSTLLAAMGKGMLPMQLADAGWTTVGAAVAFDYYRRNNIKSGMDETLVESAALDQLEMMIAESAQPADPANRSLIEGLQNPWLKSMWMFASEHRKTLAVEIMALRRLATGKSKNKAMDVQRAVVAHVVMATTTQLMAGILSLLMGDDDDREREWSVEEWASAIVAGPINGLFLFGDAFNYIGRRLFGLHAFEPSTAIGQAVKAVSSAPSILDEAINGEPEEQRKAFLRLSEALGQAAAIVGPGNPFTAADVILGNPLKDAEKILSRVEE